MFTYKRKNDVLLNADAVASSHMLTNHYYTYVVHLLWVALKIDSGSSGGLADKLFAYRHSVWCMDRLCRCGRFV